MISSLLRPAPRRLFVVITLAAVFFIPPIPRDFSPPAVEPDPVSPHGTLKAPSLNKPVEQMAGNWNGRITGMTRSQNEENQRE